MASVSSGSVVSERGNDIGRNAGRALDALVIGPHRDKRIARLFGITPRMARYLRIGKHWTIERLALASSLFGEEFDRLLVNAQLLVSEPMLSQQALADRLNELETQLAELRRLVRVGRAWE
jgi:hypothetical protein